MARPNVRITLENGIVDVLTPSVRVEVHDYDIAGLRNHKQLWTDERGKRCLRYFVSAEGGADGADPVADDLESFAVDLQTHAGVSASFRPDSSSDGLHVLTINDADFYFVPDTGKYDGWGKLIV